MSTIPEIAIQVPAPAYSSFYLQADCFTHLAASLPSLIVTVHFGGPCSIVQGLTSNSQCSLSFLLIRIATVVVHLGSAWRGRSGTCVQSVSSTTETPPCWKTWIELSAIQSESWLQHWINEQTAHPWYMYLKKILVLWRGTFREVKETAPIYQIWP